MARDGLRTKLRAAIRQTGREPACTAHTDAQMDCNGDAVVVSIRVQPVHTDGEKLLLVSFSDRPEHSDGRKVVSEGIDPPHIAQLEQELDATRKELESAIRDLETTNDELTATNEEAMSVNEELQSSNEELETSKEELQSLNEELTALNTQLSETIEHQRVTANDLRNTMNSSEIAMLFLDRNLEIRLFTPAARTMRWRKSRNGMIGSRACRSTGTKAASATTAIASGTRTSAPVHTPARPASRIPRSSAAIPTVKRATPVQSKACRRRTATSGNVPASSAMATAPNGRLT